MQQFLISVLNGKLDIRTNPNLSPFGYPWDLTSIPFRSPIESESIDRFLNLEFVSRLAAKLWRGDSGAAVSDALSLIHECSEGLAFRKSPLWDIDLGNPQLVTSRSNTHFWKRFSLESIIEIAAAAGHSEQPKGAAARAFSIIENARTALEKNSKPQNKEQRNDSAADRRSLRKNWAGRLLEDYKPHWPWEDAARRVTGIKRLGRAERAFVCFLKDPSVCNTASLSHNVLERAIEGRKKQGFSLDEVRALEVAFKKWRPTWIKSRQRDSGKRVGAKNLKKKSG